MFGFLVRMACHGYFSVLKVSEALSEQTVKKGVISEPGNDSLAGKGTWCSVC